MGAKTALCGLLIVAAPAVGAGACGGPDFSSGGGGASSGTSSSGAFTSSGTGGGGGGACPSCPPATSPCKTATCDAGQCGFAPIAAGTPLADAQQSAGDCSIAKCDGKGAKTTEPDDSDLPNDGNECTIDGCASGAPKFQPKPVGTHCSTQGGTICDAAGKCVTASCTDGSKDGTETDVDCGGPSCSPCEAGKTCVGGVDCKSGVCADATKTCKAPSCTDLMKNGSETDVDCGGSCPLPCGNGKQCAVGGDCSSGVCSLGVCQPPTCSDGVSNGSETGVDCGGTCAAGCTAGEACVGGSDCISGVCLGGTCHSPTCSDNVMNGSETDVDCGGACKPCTVGQACGSNDDCICLQCSSGICCTNCDVNGVTDGNETDVDCGGGDCPPCGAGQSCAVTCDCLLGLQCCPNAINLVCGAVACNQPCN